MKHWTGIHERREAFNIGLRYGKDCASCCVALTGLMFAVGMANALWMLLLGALMAATKTKRYGETISMVVAAALFVSSLAFLLL